MGRITEQEYWDEVKALAKSVRVDAKERAERDGGGGLEDYLCEALREAVDGRQWVIYTFYNSQVLSFSENPGAVENIGVESAVHNGEIDWAVLAFCALEADVQSHMSEEA